MKFLICRTSAIVSTAFSDIQRKPCKNAQLEYIYDLHDNTVLYKKWFIDMEWSDVPNIINEVKRSIIVNKLPESINGAEYSIEIYDTRRE